MSRPLEVGDLVFLKGKPCCGKGNHAGKIFQIAGFQTKRNGVYSFCRARFPVRIHALSKDSVKRKGYDINRLVRIPPLSELEQTKEHEELPA